jgi:DNA-binding transcriptional LysR family regulator
MHITLRQISYFLAAAETGSISAAAVRLAISQSAVTESIRTLEDQTGVTLFERNSKGVALTYQGHQMMRHARLILSAVDDAGRALSTRPESVTGTLNLGVTSLVAGYFLADILARFRRVFLNVEVKVVEEERPYIEHLLVNGELQLALMIISNLENRTALGYETLVRSRNRVWMAPSHPFAKKTVIGFSEIAQEPLIALSIDEMPAITSSWWGMHGLRPNIALNTSSVEAVRGLVATGAGITVLPDMTYRPWSLEGDRLEARPLAVELPTLDVGLAWRRGSKQSEVSNIFRQLAQERS